MSQKGATSVEAALALPLFLLLMLVMVYYWIYQHQRIWMHGVVDRAVRQAMQAGSVPGSNMTAIIISKVVEESGGRVDATKVSVCPVSTPACTAFSTGGQGSFFVVRVEYENSTGLTVVAEAFGVHV